MVHNHHHHRRHPEKKKSSSSIGSSTTTSDVASQLRCDDSNPNNSNNKKNKIKNRTTSSSASEKSSCRPFKAKDLWRIYGSLIARCKCNAAPPPPRNNNNNNSSIPTTTSPRFSSPPQQQSSSSSSSSSSSNGDRVGLEEGDHDHQPAAPGLAYRVESQRIEEYQETESDNNNTMNGIHSFRYTTTTTDHHSPPAGAGAATATTTTSTTTPKILKQISKEKDELLRTITNPLSRIGSKRSPSPSPSKNGIPRSVSPLTFVHRCITGRKPATTTTTPPPPPADHDPSALSRNASQRSTTTAASTAAAKLGGGGGGGGGLTRDASVRSSTSSSNNNGLGGFSRNPSQRSTTPIMFSNSTGRKVKPPPVQQNLECTLEELFYGCTKKVKVTRDVLTDRGHIVQEEETLSIQVKPGWRRGTKITFEGMGNERLGSEPADLTLVIAEKRHPLFRREGDDLEIAIGIPLVQALAGCDISIPLMSDSGETMNLMIQDIIYPGYQKVIPGQGMPRSKEEGARGSLRVLFLVEFPDELTEEQRAEIVSILDEEED